MAKLIIVHSASTAVGTEAAAFRAQAQAKRVKGKGAAAKVAELSGVYAGCRYIPPDNDNASAAPYYELVTVDKIDMVLNDSDAIVCDSETLIFETLQFRHPAPRAELTMLDRLSNFSYNKHDGQGPYGPKVKHMHAGPGWMVLPKPLLDTKADLSTLKILCLDIGPIWMSVAQFKALFGFDFSYQDEQAKRAAEKEDFVASKRFLAERTFVQLNYNPRAVQRREYVKAKSVVEKRLRGELPQNLIFSLYAHLHPSNFPGGVPHKHLTGRELFSKYGWNRQSRREYKVSDVLDLLKLARTLYPKTAYWRENHEGSCDHHKFRDAVAAGLEHFFSVEQEWRKELAAAERQAVLAYFHNKDVCVEYQINKEIYLAEMQMEDDGGFIPLPTEQEFTQDDEHDDYYERMTEEGKLNHQYGSPTGEEEGRRWGHIEKLVIEWLGRSGSDCPNHKEPVLIVDEKKYVEDEKLKNVAGKDRDTHLVVQWLRREAKVLGIPMPPKPKLPKSPSKLKRKKKKARSRRGKNKNRRRSAKHPANCFWRLVTTQRQQIPMHWRTRLTGYCKMPCQRKACWMTAAGLIRA